MGKLLAIAHPVDTVGGVPSPARRIAGLGMPLLLAALSTSASGIIDTAMMGHYGAADLTAVAAGSAVFDLFASIVLASIVGHQILAARFAGRDDPAGVRESLRSSIWFCGALATLLTFLCIVAGGWLTGLISDNRPVLQHIGAQYLAARGPTLLLLVAFSLLAATFNAYQRPRYATGAGIVVNVVNLVLDVVLIFGVGPAPRLGALGNGLATTISWLIGLAYLLLAARRFRLREVLAKPGPGTPVDFVVSIPMLSWPAIVSSALDYGTLVVFFAIIGGLGGAALAGGRIGFELMVMLFAVASAFAAGARILIGRSAGARKVGESRVFWRTGQRMLVVPAVLVGAGLILVPRLAALVFTSFTPVVNAAAAVMPLVGIALPFLAWTLGNSSVLRALGQTRLDMYGNILAVLCIQLPLAWALTNVAHFGVSGAFVAVLAYWCVRAVLTEIFARRGLNRALAKEGA